MGVLGYLMGVLSYPMGFRGYLMGVLGYLMGVLGWGRRKWPGAPVPGPVVCCFACRVVAVVLLLALTDTRMFLVLWLLEGNLNLNIQGIRYPEYAGCPTGFLQDLMRKNSE